LEQNRKVWEPVFEKKSRQFKQARSGQLGRKISKLKEAGEIQNFFGFNPNHPVLDFLKI
jgi:hypothetical protein